MMEEYRGAPAGGGPPCGGAGRRALRDRPLRDAYKTWAAELGLNQAVKFLETTLGEEKKTDEHSPSSRRVGSTSTRRRRDGKIEGHSHNVRIVAASAVSICSVYRA